MPVILIGGSPSTPVDRHKFRYHITWCFIAAPYLPGVTNNTLGTHQLATALQESLPALGLVPVSPVAAVTGDPFIQFTCQVGYTGPGGDIKTIADIIEAADKLPTLAAGTPLRFALDVCEVEVRASGLSGDIVRAQNAVGRQRALDRAKATDIAVQTGEAIGDVAGGAADAAKSLGDKIDEYAKKLFGGLADVAKFALGMAAIVGIVYVVARYRK